MKTRKFPENPKNLPAGFARWLRGISDSDDKEFFQIFDDRRDFRLIPLFIFGLNYTKLTLI